MKDYIFKNKIYTGISIVILILLWKLLSIIVGMEIVFPSPETTFIHLVELFKSPVFITSVVNTVLRSLIGFFVALFFALILGISAGVMKPIYYLLEPLITAIKATPTIGIILLALIWLESNQAPILIGFLIIFPVMYSNVVEGIYSVDSDLIEMAYIYRVNKWRILKEVYIPSILSYLMASISTAIGLNLKVVIAAEVLSQSLNSIGDNLYLEKIKLNTAGVFAWIIVAIIVAWILESILRILYRFVVKWR